MSDKRPRVRRLVLSTFISWTLITFLAFTFFLVMLGFDLEDRIFNHQVHTKANELQTSLNPLEASSGTSGALPMDYYLGTDDMPEWMSPLINPEWDNGEYEIFAEERGHFHVALRKNQTRPDLYVVFNARPYIRSTSQIKAYLFIIAVMAGLIFCMSLYFVHRMTRKVTQPLEHLATQLKDDQPIEDTTKPQLHELKMLTQALTKRDQRINTLLERDRQFNRDVSHELRTPLSVAYGASEVLEMEGQNSPAFHRLTTSLQDMQLLTEGILWLGKEPDLNKSCAVGDICRSITSTYQNLLANRDVAVTVTNDTDTTMPVPEAVARVLVGNLVRNAFSYTDKGSVTIALKPHTLSIEDTGVGFGNVSDDRTGFGVGLSLVQRLCQHFSLDLVITPKQNGGTSAVINW